MGNREIREAYKNTIRTLAKDELLGLASQCRAVRPGNTVNYFWHLHLIGEVLNENTWGDRGNTFSAHWNVRWTLIDSATAFLNAVQLDGALTDDEDEPGYVEFAYPDIEWEFCYEETLMDQLTWGQVRGLEDAILANDQASFDKLRNDVVLLLPAIWAKLDAPLDPQAFPTFDVFETESPPVAQAEEQRGVEATLGAV